MKTKTRNLLLGLAGLVAMPFVADKSLLKLEEKEVLIQGFDYWSASADVPLDSPLQTDVLYEILAGEDIIPGLPEQGAMCAKTMRALGNSILGEPYFKHHRLLSKTGYKITGQEELAADQYGINGDAWHMIDNVENAGGQLIYFTENPREDSDQSVQFMLDNSKVGDIIGFYYPDSQYNEIAQEAGPGFTHMGFVVGHKNETNEAGEEIKSPIIAHLFHSDQYFPAWEEGIIESAKNELLSRVYGVDHSTVPAFRVETLTSMETDLVFNGYVSPYDETIENQDNYQPGEPILYVKAVLRPAYNVESDLIVDGSNINDNLEIQTDLSESENQTSENNQQTIDDTVSEPKSIAQVFQRGQMLYGYLLGEGINIFNEDGSYKKLTEGDLAEYYQEFKEFNPQIKNLKRDLKAGREYLIIDYNGDGKVTYQDPRKSQS